MNQILIHQIYVVEFIVKITQIDRCNVYTCISGLMPPFQLVVYFYNADGLLIDAGSANILKEASLILKNETIKMVALTHVHEDHTGMAHWLQKEKNIPIYIHKNSINEASQNSNIPLYRRVVWGNRRGFHAQPIPEVLQTEHYTFDVYDAPGHHPHHIVLHEKNMGWLFTGDLFVSIRQLVAFKDENITDTIVSLQKLLSLDFDIVFCGHSGVHKNGKEKMKKKLEYFMDIQSKVKALKEKGFSIEEIDTKLFPKKNLWTIVSGGEWSSRNIVKTVY